MAAIGWNFSGDVRRLNLPERGGIDKVGVAPDQLGKGGFHAALGVIAEQFGVGFRLHLTQVITDTTKIRQSFLGRDFSKRHCDKRPLSDNIRSRLQSQSPVEPFLGVYINIFQSPPTR